MEQLLENTALDSPLVHMREPLRLTQEGTRGQAQLRQVWDPGNFPNVLSLPVDLFFLYTKMLRKSGADTGKGMS